MCSWTMLDHPKSVSWEMRKASIHKRLKKLCRCRCCFPARSRHKRTRQKNIIKYVDLSKQTSKQSSNSFQCKVDQECRIVSPRCISCTISLAGLYNFCWHVQSPVHAHSMAWRLRIEHCSITFVKITHCYALKYCMH